MDYGPGHGEASATFATHAWAFVGESRAWVLGSSGPFQMQRGAWSVEAFVPKPMTTADDRNWLELARAGDRAAFGRLVRQHLPRVHRLAMHLTGNAGDADDIVQETFLRAYRAIGSFDGRADIFTWLYRICVNVALNARRQRKRITTDLSDPRVPEPIADGTGSDPAYAAERAEAYRSLSSAIDGLSEALRTTLVLACVDQVPYAMIAEILGCSEGTVAWRVHEARRRLRETVSDEVIGGFEPPDAGEKGGGRAR